MTNPQTAFSSMRNESRALNSNNFCRVPPLSHVAVDCSVELIEHCTECSEQRVLFTWDVNFDTHVTAATLSYFPGRF